MSIAFTVAMLVASPGCKKKPVVITQPDEPVKKETKREVDPRFKPNVAPIVEEPKEVPVSADERVAFKATLVELGCAVITNKGQALEPKKVDEVLAKHKLTVDRFSQIKKQLETDAALALEIKNEVEKCPKPVEDVVVKKKRKKRDYSHLKELKRGDVMPVIKGNTGKMKACFSRVFKNIQAGGTVKVHFTINHEGRAVGMSIKAPGIPVGTAKKCVQTVISSMKFPSNHRPMPVSIPINLKVKM
ncbi:MAG: AgmX/PglI C-terminal domain-containing protein [Myxococcales bacterium]|nr:AgmX/PglI C-terminal domain-containing protein [Myxococcales bacterium]